MGRKVLTVDIGGTFIKYALMNDAMEMLEKGKVPTPTEGRQDLIECLGKLYDAVPQAEGISISMPGIIDPEKGYCAMGGALTYNNDFYLREALQQRCPVPVYMANDAKCAAMAEASAGALKEYRDGFVILLGTMIGGGYIKDHQVVMGKHFSAGEVSYLNTTRDQLPLKEHVWGNVSSAAGLCRDYAAAKGLTEEEVDGIRVFQAVAAGEETACRVLDHFARGVAVVIFNIQTVLDVEMFAIGGGISAQPVLIEAIRKNLEELYAGCPYYVPRAEVTACAFLNDANLIGALQNYLKHVPGKC